MASVISFPRREIQIVGLISLAHFLSHFYLYSLVPHYQTIAEHLGVGLGTLSLGITAYVICTGVLQTPMGYLVDRVGGRKVLVGGLFVLAGSIGSVSFVTELWQFIALMALAGLGNSVFHPADYSIISVSIEEDRLGKAFSFHSLGGSSGMLVGPAIMGLLITLEIQWQTAIIIAGAVGIALAFVLLVFGRLIGEGGATKKKAPAPPWRLLLTSKPLLLLLLFYLCSSAANAGIAHFSVAALGAMYGIPVVSAALALTFYLGGSLALTLPGGILADRTDNHHGVMILCLAVSAVMIALAGLGYLPFWLVVGLLAISGGMRGLVIAARDVSVRHSAAPHSVGTVFAFVSTGFLFGGAVTLPFYGWLVDIGRPDLVFWLSAAMSLCAIGAVILHSRVHRIGAK
jgi:MFS family permease